MVSKSFENFEFLTEPFQENDKFYIKVRNPKTGTIRKVRWYIDIMANQDKALGFQKGYITIFKGENEDWFEKSIARYARFWGWYIPSTEEIPKDLPDDLIPITLNWDLVGIGDRLKPEKEVEKIIKELKNDYGR